MELKTYNIAIIEEEILKYLLGAGFTIAATSEKTGLSPRTILRKINQYNIVTPLRKVKYMKKVKEFNEQHNREFNQNNRQF